MGFVITQHAALRHAQLLAQGQHSRVSAGDRHGCSNGSVGISRNTCGRHIVGVHQHHAHVVEMAARAAEESAQHLSLRYVDLCHAKSICEPCFPTDQRQCDAFTLTRLLPPPPPALRTLPCSVVISTLSISAPLRLCTHTTLSPVASSRVCATGLSLSELHFGEETQIVWPLDWNSNVHCRPLTRLSPDLERSKRETI